MTDAADARLLLLQSPDDYIAERTRLVKEARAAGDRETAKFYQSLKRPPLSVWAVLAAAEDAAAVNEVVAATEELAKVQAAGSSSAALTTATKKRRSSIESLVDRAVRALGKTESAAEARRAEIRGMIDQLSRHPELAEAWIDGTLRDLPDDALGFTAFADLEVTGTASPAAKQSKAAKRSSTASEPEAEPGPEPDEGKATRRIARAAETKQARQDVTAAAREVTVVERRVDAARAEARKAERALRDAEAALATAQNRHDAARDLLESLRADELRKRVTKGSA